MRDGQTPVMEFTRFFSLLIVERALGMSGANSMCVLGEGDVSDVRLWGRYRA